MPILSTPIQRRRSSGSAGTKEQYHEMRLDEVIEELKTMSEEIEQMMEKLLEIKILIRKLEIPELMNEAES